MNANIAAGTAVTLHLTDGTTLSGDFVSINSKGYNVRVDGKVISRALSKVANVTIDAPAVDSDMFDGYSDDEALTTAALAALFDTDRKALRVELRRVGLGVGKGSTYALTPAIVRPLVAQIRDGLVARAS